jgi:hypothetical protein
MNNRRAKLAELLVSEAFAVDRLPPVQWEHVLREYNPWTAPLATPSEPEGAGIDSHREFPL